MLSRIRRRILEWNLFECEDQPYDMNHDSCQETTNIDPKRLQAQLIMTRIYVISLTSK